MIQKEQLIKRESQSQQPQTGGKDYFISQEAKDIIDPESIINSPYQQNPPSIETKQQGSSTYGISNLDGRNYKVSLEFVGLFEPLELIGVLHSYSVRPEFFSKTFKFRIQQRVANNIVDVTGKPITASISNVSVVHRGKIQSITIENPETTKFAFLDLCIQFE